MSSEIRTFIRQINKWYRDPEHQERALNSLIKGIKEADEKGEYTASYAYIMKLAEIYKDMGQKDKAYLLYYQAAVRASLLGKEEDVKKSAFMIPEEHPYRSIINTLEGARTRDGEKHFYLLDLEYRTIFGDFIKISPLPMIDFEDEEEAQVILEDYYPYGLYHAHIIERASFIKERVDIAVGKKEVIDEVETITKYVLR